MSRTYRRKLLDDALEHARSFMTGTVIDLGGKRSSPRGYFRPHSRPDTRWVFVNLDQSTNPDVYSDIANVPLESESAECVICTETLQHVTDPQAVINEAFRLLKPGGTFVGSIPFLYPVHRDPADYWRLGPDGLELAFSSFQEIKIYEMGGTQGVFGLFLERVASGVKFIRPVRVPIKLFIRLIAAPLFVIDSGNRLMRDGGRVFTTGYFFVCRKPD